MKQRTRVAVQPSSEPITLAELKAHLRITSTAEDTLLTSLITAGRQVVERYLGRKLISQTIELYADCWPCDYEFEIPFAPVSAVSFIKTYAEDDTESTLDAGSYILEATDQDRLSRIVLKSGYTWPTGLREAKGIMVSYTCGYGASASYVPQAIRQAVLMMAAHMYANRGDCMDPSTCVNACGVACLLSSYMVFSL